MGGVELLLGGPTSPQPGQPGDAGTAHPRLRSVTFRPFLAGDAVQLQLQPSQHVTLGINSATIGMDDALELEELSVDAWTAVGGDGRLLVCFGMRMLWPAAARTNGHAVAWAMLASGLGPDHLAITRFIAAVVAGSRLTRIEAIVRAGVRAEAKWPPMLGFELAGELPAYGPDGETHLLFQRVKAFAGGSADRQPRQPRSAEAAHHRPAADHAPHGPTRTIGQPRLAEAAHSRLRKGALE